MDRDRYRTQLYLDEAQYRFLKESAAKYKTSIAGVVRTLIDREMGGTESIDETDPLFRIAGAAVRTGRADGSAAHDRYIYERPASRPSRRPLPERDLEQRQ